MVPLSIHLRKCNFRPNRYGRIICFTSDICISVLIAQLLCQTCYHVDHKQHRMLLLRLDFFDSIVKSGFRGSLWQMHEPKLYIG